MGDVGANLFAGFVELLVVAGVLLYRKHRGSMGLPGQVLLGLLAAIAPAAIPFWWVLQQANKSIPGGLFAVGLVVYLLWLFWQPSNQQVAEAAAEISISKMSDPLVEAYEPSVTILHTADLSLAGEERRKQAKVIFGVYLHIVRFWNTGKTAFKNLPITLHLAPEEASSLGALVGGQEQVVDYRSSSEFGGPKLDLTLKEDGRTIEGVCDLFNRGQSFDVEVRTIRPRVDSIKVGEVLVAARAEGLGPLIECDWGSKPVPKRTPDRKVGAIRRYLALTVTWFARRAWSLAKRIG